MYANYPSFCGTHMCLGPIANRDHDVETSTCASKLQAVVPHALKELLSLTYPFGGREGKQQQFQELVHP